MGWYAAGVRGFSFHYYAINQARLCIRAQKTWHFCWISLPRELERRGRAHTQGNTTHKASNETNYAQNRLGWISPSLLWAGLQSTHCNTIFTHRWWEISFWLSTGTNIISSVLTTSGAIYSPFDWLVIFLLATNVHAKKNIHFSFSSKEEHVSSSSERCRVREGALRINWEASQPTHQCWRVRSSGGSVRPPTCRVGSWKGKFRLNCGGAILCLWVRFRCPQGGGGERWAGEKKIVMQLLCWLQPKPEIES